jgi:hypothetical protein
LRRSRTILSCCWRLLSFPTPTSNLKIKRMTVLLLCSVNVVSDGSWLFSRHGHRAIARYRDNNIQGPRFSARLLQPTGIPSTSRVRDSRTSTSNLQPARWSFRMRPVIRPLLLPLAVGSGLKRGLGEVDSQRLAGIYVRLLHTAGRRAV